MNDEVEKVNLSLLKQVQSVVDSNIKNVIEISTQVSLDPTVEELSRVYNDFGQEDSYKLMKTQEQLNIKTSYIDIVHEVAIYFKNTNSIMSSNGFYRSDMLTNYIENINLYNNDFNYFINKKNFKEIIPITYKQYPKTISLLQSFPMSSPKTNYGTVMIIINSETMKSIIEAIEWLELANVYIIDNNDTIMFTSNDKEYFEITYKELEKEEEVFNRDIEGNDMAIYSIKSSVVDWRYVVTYPDHVFKHEAKKIRNYTFLWMGICLIIGSTIVYYFTRENYNPIRKLINYFNDSNEVILTNEYEYIEKCIEDTLNNQREIQRKLRKQEKVLQNNFLVKLLKGKIGSEFEIINGLLSYGIEFKKNNFVIMLFKINDYNSNLDDNINDYELAQFIVNNIYVEIINDTYKGCSTEIEELLALIINLGDNNNQVDFESIIHKAYNQVKQYYDIDFTVSISNQHKTVLGITEAYREALDAMEYTRILGCTDTIFYKDTLKSNSRYDFPIEMEQKLINFIKMGDYSHSEDILNEVFKINYEDYFISVQMAQCLVFDIISSMLKAIDDKEGNRFIDELDPITRILKQSTPDNIKSELLKILKEVCDYKSNMISNYKKDKISIAVDRYIHEHYSNFDLNVSVLSDYFNISPAYLSKLYKQETSISILDKINQFRIYHAKEHLVNNEETITKIAEKVGYSNVNVFIRIFKKYEGVTPGQYRISQQK